MTRVTLESFPARALLFSLAIAAAACGGKKGQSFSTAMATVCDATRPDEVDPMDRAAAAARLREHLLEQVTNQEARKLLAGLAETDPLLWGNRLDEAARRSGLARCAMAEEMGLLPIEPTRVNASLPAERISLGSAPLVTVTPEAISVAGQRVVALDGRKRSPEEMWKIEPIPELAEALESLAPGSGSRWNRPLDVVVAPAVRYEILFRVIATTGAGWSPSLLVSTGGGDLARLPITVPDHVLSDEPRLDLVVTVAADELTLWSISGEEGSESAPRLVLKPAGPPGRADRFDLTPLEASLEEIARRRWGHEPQPFSGERIIVQLAPDLPFQTFAEVVASLVSDSHGRLRLASIVLSILID